MPWFFWSVVYAVLAVPAWFGFCIGWCFLVDPNGKSGVGTAYAFLGLLGSPVAAIVASVVAYFIHRR